MAKRILFITSQSGINGGIKVAYQHAAALRRHGFDAAIVHQAAKPPDWFAAPEVPILAVGKVRTDAEDVLVIGEDVHGTLQSWARIRGRKVVLCQNHFYVTKGLGNAPDYREFGVSAIVTTGEVITDFITRRFPGLPVSTVHLAIDPMVFRPLEKQLRIAVVPRKRPLELAYIKDLLGARHPEWQALNWAVLQNATEDLVARVLGRSAVFLSLARFEGVGLTALEAMACGCAVTGFHGGGGREYATAANGYWAAEDALDEAVDRLHGCLRAVVDGTAVSTVAAGRETAAAYSVARMEAELVGFWRNFLG